MNSKRYHVQRICTCKKGQRFYECVVPNAYHTVDESHDSASSAIREAAQLSEEVGVSYRAVDSHTGLVIE